MDFLPKEIADFTELYTQKENELLQELNRDTYANVLTPRMLAGHLQGRTISMLSKMIQPNRVLEIGTYTGYSAICWSEGLRAGGMVHTIDINEDLGEMVNRYIAKADREGVIRTYIGSAIDIIPKIKEKFDVVYIDADKGNYSNYYDMTFDSLNPGGYIIADNVLWSGKVVEPEEQMDDDTRALVAYCRKVHNDDRVENVLFPIRDGLMIARKK